MMDDNMTRQRQQQPASSSSYKLVIEVDSNASNDYPYVLLPRDIFDTSLPEQIGPSSIPQTNSLCWQRTNSTNVCDNGCGDENASRSGEIEITSIDRIEEVLTTLTISSASTTSHPVLLIGSVSVPTITASHQRDGHEGLSTYIPFLTGTSKVVSGIIHLYRDLEKVITEEEEQEEKESHQSSIYDPEAMTVRFDYPRGTVMLIIAIPAAISPSALLAGYFETRTLEWIDRIRLVRDAAPNRYMALVQFRTPAAAKQFRLDYDQRPYAPDRPETGRVVAVRSVEFKLHSGYGGGGGSFRMLEPLFTPSEWPSMTISADEQEWQCSGGGDRSKVHQQQQQLLVELPTCPVCLERMDSSVTGLVTSICRHTFHCECLLKWMETRCPVCRYVQLADEVTNPNDPARTNDDIANRNHRPACAICETVENVWMCLICGHAGCGRYRAGHAYDHFSRSGHNFALEVETLRVWDYLGDNYVHRMIQQMETHGRSILEIPVPDEEETPELKAKSPLQTSKATTSTNNNNNDAAEYMSSLLVAQLESQRVYFEDRLDQLEGSLRSSLTQLKLDHQGELERAAERISQMDQDILRLTQTRSTLESRITDLTDQRDTLHRDLTSERRLVEQLTANQDTYRTMLEQRNRTIDELNEQVTDLLAHFDSQQALATSALLPEEVRHGKIMIRTRKKKNNNNK